MHRVSWLHTLPPIEERLGDCFGTGRRSRLGRLLTLMRRRNSARTCCNYHAGDWFRVSRTAIRLVRRAQHQGIPADDVVDFVMAQPEIESLTKWERGFLRSLLPPGVGIEVHDDNSAFADGRHRTQAMIDAGVRRTVVIAWRSPGE